MIDKNSAFSEELTNWYTTNKRDLPWRNTQIPYFIWLSEIILQQTRVDQGLSYFLKFQKNYPTVSDLANAEEDAVLKDWQGLGYYSRARNLHNAAKYIHEELNGQFPSTFEDIKKLKGVGDYTAAAIASFAFKLPHAVVDGNVYRVLARYYGIKTAIDSTKGKKEFQTIADQVLNKKEPDLHNQAIMEFGALQCTPKNPNCEICPLQNNCIAFQENTIDSLPFKEGKIKQRKRYFHYLIIQEEDSIYINKRQGKGIWQNLYEFPLIETKKETKSDAFLKSTELKTLLKDLTYTVNQVSESRKHILSHQILTAQFYHIRLVKDNNILTKKFERIPVQELEKYAVSKLIENYVREETNLLSLFD